MLRRALENFRSRRLVLLRLTLISRMGADNIQTALPPILAAVTEAEHPVVWCCVPMHGNTFTSDTGRKTRDFDVILREIAGFFAAHRAAGTWPGGVHLELTGDDVTECLGGAETLGHGDLDERTDSLQARADRRTGDGGGATVWRLLG